MSGIRRTAKAIKGFTRLGREIKISPKSNVSINEPGYSTEFYVETVTVTIGIGKDHVAQLVMEVDAWNALKDGEPLHVETTEEFRNKYVKRHE